MDLRKLGPGEVIAGVSAIVLVAAMGLLDWFGVDVPPGTEPIGGFDAFRAFDVVDLILLVTAIGAIALVVLTATQTRTDVPITLSAFLAIFGIFSFLLLVFRVIDPPDLTGGRFALDFAPLNTGFETSREIGIYVGLLATLGITVGAWISMRDERTGR